MAFLMRPIDYYKDGRGHSSHFVTYKIENIRFLLVVQRNSNTGTAVRGIRRSDYSLKQSLAVRL